MSKPQVPVDHRSQLPSLLRALALTDPLTKNPAHQRLLEDAAAEIEGGEEAYAAVVDEIRGLREKVTRLERNLR